MLGSLKIHVQGGQQSKWFAAEMQQHETNIHTHTHTPIRWSVLTVLLEDSGDCFVHILLQFCTVEAEAALEGDKTNGLC